eukprot:Hpha_TRINITY_DN15471_c5_g13::TRINITY_DN15471_c5_g13_i1::g.176766::m.176766/K19758/DYX1C1, DNAAF4; dyslexia susceptibility 1 candidate gene 1 protein
MPLQPDHQFEETDTTVTVRVFLKRVSKKAIDVTVYDTFMRVSCPPHVFEADLKYAVDDLQSRHVVEEDCTVRVTMPKQTPGLVWETLAAEGLTKEERQERRAEAEVRSQEAYTNKLQTRKDRKAVEEKRFFHEHWDLEKQQRVDIEEKVAAERQEVKDDIAKWAEEVEGGQTAVVAPAPEPGSAAAAREALEAVVTHRSKATNWGKGPSLPKPKEEESKDEGHKVGPERPVPTLLDDSVGKEEKEDRWRTAAERHQAAKRGEIREADKEKIFGPADVLPAPRGDRETATIDIDFTPSNLVAMPQRQRCDEEIYRRSMYKPKDLKDTPLYFKEQGDKLYGQKQWKSAADQYSEALKRDTTYLSALNNRSICWLQLHKYERAVEDTTLSLNMLQSMPAANTTGDRFRAGMMKLFARRGAALCWAGKLREGLKDYEMAEGYSVGDLYKEEVVADLAAIRDTLQARGELTHSEAHPLAIRKVEADRMMGGVGGQRYQDAYDIYTEILEKQNDYWDVVANRVVCCLYLRKFQEAISECDRIIMHCQNVASALAQGGVGDLAQTCEDSDDEEDDLASDDSAGGQVNRSERKRASKLVKTNTSSVYMLLKAYIRKGGALAGMKNLRGAYEHFELALRIVPYDDDLRWDAEQLRQKLQLTNVISAATGKEKELM